MPVHRKFLWGSCIGDLGMIWVLHFKRKKFCKNLKVLQIPAWFLHGPTLNNFLRIFTLSHGQGKLHFKYIILSLRFFNLYSGLTNLKNKILICIYRIQFLVTTALHTVKHIIFARNLFLHKFGRLDTRKNKYIANNSHEMIIKNYFHCKSECERYLLLKVTCNDISVIYVTAIYCKKNVTCILYTISYLQVFYFHDICKDNCFVNIKCRHYIFYLHLHIKAGHC